MEAIQITTIEIDYWFLQEPASAFCNYILGYHPSVPHCLCVCLGWRWEVQLKPKRQLWDCTKSAWTCLSCDSWLLPQARFRPSVLDPKSFAYLQPRNPKPHVQSECILSCCVCIGFSDNLVLSSDFRPAFLLFPRLCSPLIPGLSPIHIFTLVDWHGWLLHRYYLWHLHR